MKSIWRWLALATLLAVNVGIALAESRTWSNSADKSEVEAELVEVKNGKATLRSSDGEEVSILLKNLSDADRTYIKSHPTTAKAVSPSAATKVVREVATKFFNDLRTKEREISRDTLTEAAQKLVKEKHSFLTALPSPDKQASAVRLGKVKLDGDQAEVLVTVRVDGEQQATTLHLRKEDDKWRAFAISEMVGEEELTIDFESPLGKNEEQKDPLPALIGKPLALAGITADGTALDMSKYKGKIVLVDFWATWCGPCRKEMPNVLANWKKYHESGFEVIAISVDRQLDALQKFMIEEKPPWTVVADHHPLNPNPMGAKYGVRGIPAMILIGPDGVVAAVHCRGEQMGREIEKLIGKATPGQK